MQKAAHKVIHEVKIIIAHVGRTALHADEMIGGIPQYYAAKYRDIKVKQEADQELTAGFLLKQYLGVWDDAQLIRNGYGKPSLRSGKAYFNLSHSGDYVVLAVADMDIGTDMEKIMDVHWPSVRKIFSLKQQMQLEQTPKLKQPGQFTMLWTECEAVLKLLGTGFAEPAAPVERAVHWISYRDYVIACAAYEEFNVSVEEAEWIEKWGQGKCRIR